MLHRCPGCGSSIVPRALDRINYIYKDNILITCNGRCKNCGERFFYIEKSNTLYDIVFPKFDYGFCKQVRGVCNIYTSYIPILPLVEEYKNRILELKKNNDIVIGFDGWEDIVIDKKLAGGWYMTYNSPPILDIAILNCINKSFGRPNIIMSYFPSPMLNGSVSILDNKTVDFFESKRSVMLDEKRDFYIGIRENYK
jgi:hypothetical protein